MHKGNRGLRSMLRLLRAEGVTYYKDATIEVQLDGEVRPQATVGKDGLPVSEASKVPFTTDEVSDPLEALFYHERS